MIPAPAVNQDNAYFWDGFAVDELRLQRCARCGRLRHPASPACPKCSSLEWDAVVASGRGEVFSHATIHHPLAPPYDEPYVVAVIELEEGVRLLTRLLDNHTDERIRVGALVQVAFTEVAGVRLPLFRLAS